MFVVHLATAEPDWPDFGNVVAGQGYTSRRLNGRTLAVRERLATCQKQRASDVVSVLERRP